MNYKEEYVKLLNDAKYYSDQYYNNDISEITDYDYDLITQRIKQLEKLHPELIDISSPTQKVGGKASAKVGNVIEHRNKMLSLEDVFSKEEVEQFVTNCINELEDPTFIVETKIDGLSMSLRYKNCKLVMAETRGDGISYGEDVTSNARMIEDVVEDLKYAPEYLEIRGEVYMDNLTFEAINREQEFLGQTVFANPRNCAAGTLRQHNPKLLNERKLSLFIFNIQEDSSGTIKSHTDGYEFLRKNGVKTINKYYICKTFQEVWNSIEVIGRCRERLPYNIDGAVIKIDSFEQRKQLGETSKYPKWAIAYKYPSEEKETTIRDIKLTVGRTGKITPVAVFDTISLCGTKVSMATLHNQDYIEQLGINIGSDVLVHKSGDIIPEITKVLTKPWGPNNYYILPNTCPVCGQMLYRDEYEVDIRCINPICPAIVQRGIINYISRDAMDIKGLGIIAIRNLCGLGYLKDFTDLYLLKNHRDELIQRGIIGREASVDKLLKKIEDSKGRSAERLLTGLGIPGVGKTTAKSIMYRFGSILDVINADYREISKVNNVGDVTAIDIHNFFKEQSNRDIIDKLISYGVNVEMGVDNDEDTLYGLNFVITGTFKDYTRRDLIDIINSNGGIVSDHVTKNTHYIVVGENPGSKYNEALKIGAVVLSEFELFELINDI